jgi:hypothetical protein
MVPVSECRIPTLTELCAHAPRGQTNGAGITPAAAATTLQFTNVRRLISISLSQPVRAVRSSWRAENKKPVDGTLPSTGFHAEPA